MATSKRDPTRDDLRQSYAAMVDYHNNLVQLRFTVVGLFLATNGVLATDFFQSSLSIFSFPVLQAIGFLLAVFFWLMEVRIFQLLENLGARGLDLEKQLDIRKNQGFFFLMEDQPIGPRLLPTSVRLSSNRFFSHSVWISLLYALVGLLWLIVFIVWALQNYQTA